MVKVTLRRSTISFWGDTIEGKIYLLLNDKLTDIAKAVGKVDEHGNVAEDLRSQILGQLSERINYSQLYAQALSDPKLKRTELELVEAMDNASAAEDAVFELFQDLDSFSLDDYAPLSDTSSGMQRIVDFVRRYSEFEGNNFRANGDDQYVLETNGTRITFTTDRDAAAENDAWALMGLDHPYIADGLQMNSSRQAEALGINVTSDKFAGAIGFWLVDLLDSNGQNARNILVLAVDETGQRSPTIEKQAEKFFWEPPVHSNSEEIQLRLLAQMEEILDREIKQRFGKQSDHSYSAKLISWISVQ
jgi:hypothetical protein